MNKRLLELIVHRPSFILIQIKLARLFNRDKDSKLILFFFFFLKPRTAVARVNSHFFFLSRLFVVTPFFFNLARSRSYALTFSMDN